MICILGPTGSGKSSLGVSIAKEVKGEIISCDSVQIYRDLNIMSGKITCEEMDGISHHLLSFLNIDQDYTVCDYVKDLSGIREEIENRGNEAILVGGTGLYFSAYQYNYFFENENIKIEIKNKYSEILKNKGKSELYNHLIKLDPLGASEIHPEHHTRVLRALEYIETHGTSILQKKSIESRNDLEVYILQPRREDLYEKIGERVEIMIKQGGILEVENLLDKYGILDFKPLTTIGYKEIVKNIKGEISRCETIDMIKQNTRRYAKRQITWFKNKVEGEYLNYTNSDDKKTALEYILENHKSFLK